MNLKSNKKTVYLLLPLVAIIWGLVIYKLVVGTSNLSETPKTPSAARPFTMNNMQKTSFGLTLDYRDPMQAGKQMIVAPKPVQISTSTISPTPSNKVITPGIKWPKIIYNGKIQNKVTGKELILLNINGKEETVAVQQVIKGIKVSAAWNDSIHVTFKDEAKTVFLK